MNALLNKIIEHRDGHYCHVVEVSTVYELEIIAESIVRENGKEFSIEVIKEFLESLTIYYLSEDKEDSEEDNVYSFSFTDYINNHLI